MSKNVSKKNLEKLKLFLATNASQQPKSDPKPSKKPGTKSQTA